MFLLAALRGGIVWCCCRYLTFEEPVLYTISHFLPPWLSPHPALLASVTHHNFSLKNQIRTVVLQINNSSTKNFRCVKVDYAISTKSSPVNFVPITLLHVRLEMHCLNISRILNVWGSLWYQWCHFTTFTLVRLSYFDTMQRNNLLVSPITGSTLKCHTHPAPIAFSHS